LMRHHHVAVHEGRTAVLAVELVLLAVRLHVFLRNKFKLNYLNSYNSNSIIIVRKFSCDQTLFIGIDV
jgi:hypothetical protein